VKRARPKSKQKELEKRKIEEQYNGIEDIVKEDEEEAAKTEIAEETEEVLEVEEENDFKKNNKFEDFEKLIVYDNADSGNTGAYDKIIDEIQNDKKEGRIPSPSPKKTTTTSKKKVKKKNGVKKIFTTMLIAIVVILAVGMGCNIFDDDDILAPLENGKINVLMMGVDESGLRTDAIMVASYDVNEGTVNLLSIPRDTKTYITNKKVFKKINGIHAMPSDKDGEILGAYATSEAVTALTGIPINYYVEFSFLSIDHLFDILGPVEFDVPDIEGKGRGMNYDDPYQNLSIHLKPGLQKLKGNQVQQFLRYRKSNYHVGTGSDTDRVKRQQDFIKAVIDQKVNATIILKLPGIYTQLSKEIKTNISMGDVTKYIRYVKKLSSENVHSYSLPGECKTLSGASYWVCDLKETKKLISEVFGYDEEISDKFEITGSYSQKPIKAGNMNKPKEDFDTDAGIDEGKNSKNEDKKEEIYEEDDDLGEDGGYYEVKEPDGEEIDENIPELEPNDEPLEDIYTLD